MIRRSVLAAMLFAAAPLVSALAQPTVANAQGQPRAMTVREAFDAQQAGTLVLVDIRTPEEWAETGVPKGALRIDLQDRAFVQKLDAARKANPGKDLGLICRTANRSNYAATALTKMGWKEIVDVTGGVAGSRAGKGWFAEGLPSEK